MHKCATLGKLDSYTFKHKAGVWDGEQANKTGTRTECSARTWRMFNIVCAVIRTALMPCHGQPEELMFLHISYFWQVFWRKRPNIAWQHVFGPGMGGWAPWCDAHHGWLEKPAGYWHGQLRGPLSHTVRSQARGLCVFVYVYPSTVRPSHHWPRCQGKGYFGGQFGKILKLKETD